MKGFCLEVSGPFACFTRPEMKVERVSYDVITPSAARAVFDAILWKPAIRWQVKKIEVLAPIRWISVRRNEVGKVASPRIPGLFIEDERQQRAGLFLRDVKYRLCAEFDFIPPDKRGKVYNPVPQYLVDAAEADDLKKPDVRKDETEAKYAAMFDRRSRKGQCFNQPYLGCREFSAHVRPVDPVAEPATPIPETRDLGWMLYDMDYTNPADPKPQFFHAFIENGAIDLRNAEVRS
ncbi:MAG: type I-C CRISPR-associated protein Cas5c [Verrucomicrobia bacterium]|nr:type I-C CRISPR-associated protein Cas5c [Verrucomicrobiota bacterium]MBU1735006.1 type I-C CRISPR-associated protein Cas5c [Verrucomicrobiota bacterium]MBU1855350.1 type I-C CRISPR-associated protein Cas5c [Verrucomicrobiota bacterium]